MTAKVVNYTAEQTAKMVADYAEGVTVEAIAETLGKTVRSVVAKLSREGVYKKKTYTTKTGEAVVKKDAWADYIGQALGIFSRRRARVEGRVISTMSISAAKR